ncbi:MAG: TetR/AcrR family transcriptional regulator [Oscillospiraceae bacterium]|jgi:AcrR family transcriptional regulator|nr:TetR/AcrR family transcriptional regulator [Oscillospiraceae bacterium]
MDTRLERILNKAAELFIHNGFKKTSVEELARACAISVGGIYDFFTNKQVIFCAVIKRCVDGEFFNRPHALPLSLPLFSSLEREALRTFEHLVEKFGAPLRTRRKDYHYKDMLSDAFDMLSQYGIASQLLQANPRVCPNIFAGFNRYRQELQRQFDGFLRFFSAKGELRQLLETRLPARFMLETIYWWGAMRHTDTFQPDSAAVPAHLAKDVCVSALYHAYARDTHTNPVGA